MTGTSTTAGPIFGPQNAGTKPTHGLGKIIRLRIDLEGCRDLPHSRFIMPGNADVRPSYRVEFLATGSKHYSEANSSFTREGKGTFRGTVQWNEVLYLQCFEHSVIQIILLWRDDYYAKCLPVADLLANSEVTVGSRSRHCTLCLSTSWVFDDGVEDEREDSDVCMDAQYEGLHVIPTQARSPPTRRIKALLRAILFRIPLFVKAINSSKIFTYSTPFWIQQMAYDAYTLGPDSVPCLLSRDGDAMFKTMVATMDAILPLAITYMQQRVDCVIRIVEEMLLSTALLNERAKREEIFFPKSPEAELARLTWLIVTPDLPFGARGTSQLSNYAISGTIAKDALLFALEAIVQASDAFPPLKSAASGLLFFATYADMASGNKKQIRDIYKRVDGLAASLKRGTAKGSPLTPEHHDAIRSLAEDIAGLNKDLEEIVAERKSRFRRFFSAKRHRAELQDVVTQLETARANYTTAVATVNAMTTARVLAHVQALTLVMGVSPMPALDMNCADDVAFPSRSTCFEEV
ncbi:hypothetical protein PENSPDRAFT_757409 [Peniophora sp. CONT]|nr:hypothetical protein PENSPDRAFT_757409 [Peniophora sp. CONT]